MKTIVVAAISGVAGGALVWLFQAGSLNLTPLGMQYADLAAVMLGAVAVLLTILGVFLAIFAIWGYSQFRSIVEGAAVRHASQSIREGELKDLVEERAVAFMTTSFETGRLRRLLEDRVDQIILRGAEDRLRDVDGGQDETQDI